MGKGTAFRAAAALCLISCGTRGAADLADPPIITSATYQHTLYNGRPQAIEVRAAKEDAPPFVIRYFPSEAALYNDEGGVCEPPVDVGGYYVRIRRPAGNGYKAGPDIKVEYYIQKAFLPVSAAEQQEFSYDGAPKPACAEAPVELSFRYYPAEAPQFPLHGPPVESGRYRVLVFYPGDSRYMSFSKELELIISE
jgi:hypothetical protein